MVKAKAQTATDEDQDTVAPPPQKRKRRTKQEIVATLPVTTTTTKPVSSKKKSVQPTVAVVTTSGIQGSFNTFTKVPLIAHLDIKSTEVLFYDQPLYYNSDVKDLLNEPIPYDANTDDIFISGAEPILDQDNKGVVFDEERQDETSAASATAAAASANTTTTTQLKRKEYTPQNLLVSFASSQDTHTLPERTDVFCFWCCHQFEGRPCVIPQSCVDGIWKVYGNFCSLSCGLSYLLNQVMDTHIRWERVALLNRLYTHQQYNDEKDNHFRRIYPAPMRETLAIFGGTFSINEFRSIIQDAHIRVDVTLPPMVSILASMDTKPIDFYETSIKNTTIGGGAYVRLEEGLKLKRTKPLKDRENTLDSILQL